MLTEGGSGDATKQELDAWITAQAAPNTWSQDSASPQPGMESYFGVGRDTYLIVDLATMKIVKIDNRETTALNHLIALVP